eukprot:2315061-Prymnesium_polylepis.1
MTRGDQHGQVVSRAAPPRAASDVPKQPPQLPAHGRRTRQRAVRSRARRYVIARAQPPSIIRARYAERAPRASGHRRGPH